MKGASPARAALVSDERRHRIAQLEGPRLISGRAHFDTDKIAVRGHDEQARHRRRHDRIEDRCAAGQHVEGRAEARFDRNPETRRGVALRIEIEDQHLLADGRQRGTEVDGRRRLADAALLVGDSDDTRTRMCTAHA